MKLKKMTSYSSIVQNMLLNQERDRRQALREEGIEDLNKYKDDRETEELYAKRDEVEESGKKYYEFSDTVKQSLLQTCIDHIYKKSIPLKNVDKVGSAFVEAFVEEKGVNILLREMRYKSVILSELSGLVTKYHKIIMESADKDDPDSLEVDEEIKDEFLDELDKKEVDDVSDTIKDRVQDGLERFITDNAEDKEKIMDIIDSSKETTEPVVQISTGEDEESDEEDGIQVDESAAMANRKINKVKSSRNQSVFEAMMVEVSKSCMKDETLKESFTVDNKLDMNSILESVIPMYTFLETVNSLKLDKVDSSYIESMLNDLKA